MTQTSAFTVAPHGKRWAIMSDGETLLIAARKADAEALAKAARKTLTLDHPHEPRSFAPPDGTAPDLEP
jgi:hypothetical protein